MPRSSSALRCPPRARRWPAALASRRAHARRLGLLATPILVLALAWLAPASRAAQAQSPIAPPSHAGFPSSMGLTGAGTSLVSQPVIVDLGLTPGFAQIVFGTTTGQLFVLQHNGDGTWSPAPGWPVSVGAHIASSPAVADLDGDGIPEIVVGFGSNYDPSHPGGVSAFRRSGGAAMWTVSTAPFNDGTHNWTHAPVVGTPAIGDVDGDGKLEVVFGSFDHNVYMVDAATGAAKPGWPVDVGDTVYSSAALYDIDGDGLPDIIIGSDYYLWPGGCLRVLRYNGASVTGFPKCVNQTINSTPVVADLDGDGKPEIIVGTGAFYGSSNNPPHKVFAYHCDGSTVTGWPVTVDGQVGTTPAVADLNGDGHLDVVVTDDNTGPSGTFHVYAFKGDGTLLWKTQPKDFNGSTTSLGEVVIADVMGDGHPEILTTTGWEVVVLDYQGNQLSEGGAHAGGKYSLATSSPLTNVAVGDLETDHADGKIEVVAVSSTAAFPNVGNTTVFAWNLPISFQGTTYSDNAPPWGMYRHSIDRLGLSPGAGSCSGSCSIHSTSSQFFALPPCRIVDTRCSTGASGCSGAADGVYGSPALTSTVQRSFVLTGQCGIPAGAKAVSANVTVTGGSGSGFVAVGPGCVPQVSNVNWVASGQTRANNAVLALDVGGAVTVKSQVAPGNGTVHFVLDVNGYFQ